MSFQSPDKIGPAAVDTPGRGQIAVDWVLIRDTSTPHLQQSKQKRRAAALPGGGS
jgi:hypothetical protein